MAQPSPAAPTGQAFLPFPSLPPELRRQVWLHTLELPSDTRQVHHCVPFDRACCRPANPSQPVALQVNWESRKWATQILRRRGLIPAFSVYRVPRLGLSLNVDFRIAFPVFAVDPTTDIVYLHSRPHFGFLGLIPAISQKLELGTLPTLLDAALEPVGPVLCMKLRMLRFVDEVTREILERYQATGRPLYIAPADELVVHLKRHHPAVAGLFGQEGFALQNTVMIPLWGCQQEQDMLARYLAAYELQCPEAAELNGSHPYGYLLPQKEFPGFKLAPTHTLEDINSAIRFVALVMTTNFLRVDDAFIAKHCIPVAVFRLCEDTECPGRHG